MRKIICMAVLLLLLPSIVLGTKANEQTKPYIEKMLNYCLYHQKEAQPQIDALLEAIGPDSPHFLSARRLCKMLHYFTAMDPDMMDEIPPLSLEREFIGGCTIEKE